MGKAQFGGHALAKWKFGHLITGAYTLQEIPTVKSDDVVGRVKTYESIVRAKRSPVGCSESFKVLVKELQSLGLDIKVMNKDNQEIDLKQTFDDDEEVNMVAIDDGVFQSVTNEDELVGYEVEDPNLNDQDLLSDEDVDDSELLTDDLDEI